MHVLAARIELHIPHSQSRKQRRSVLRPILEGLRNRHAVAVAEVDHHDTWQRAAIGIAAVSAHAGHAEEIIDAAERFVWSFTDVDVLDVTRTWLE